MREYEVMLILPAEADESVVSAAVDRITKVISGSGGAVGNIDRWGRRRFAYEIADQTEGYYVVVRFAAEPSTQVELERALTLADEVVRFKVMVLPKPTKVEGTATRTKAARAAEPAEPAEPASAAEPAEPASAAELTPETEEASSPAPA